MKCRSCRGETFTTFADLGLTPNANSFRNASERDGPELFLPLRAYVCEDCKLVQLSDIKDAGFFFNASYPYFSSWSTTWLAHAQKYAAKMIEDRQLGADALVVELASNDGCLLKYFQEKGVPVLGIDPAANCAEAARTQHGIETIVDFFGKALARQLVQDGRSADLIAANNVLAHVPDPNDFVGGVAVLLKPGGIATFEFPHLVQLIANRQFDTIYHEHYSYLSALALKPLFERHGLRLVKVEQLSTHGGSLRLHVAHQGSGARVDASVAEILAQECAAGLDALEVYQSFAQGVARLKRQLLSLLIGLKEEGKSIAAYGAPAKGNTLLNFCGIGRDMIDFTVDRSDWKQGLWLPGTDIPVLAPEAIDEARPDYVLILPWNLKNEIMGQMAHVRDWGGQFIVPIPEPKVV